MSISKEAKAAYDKSYRALNVERIRDVKSRAANSSRGRELDRARHTAFNAKPDIRRRNFIKKLRDRYALSLEQFDGMLLAQQGRCEICSSCFSGTTEPHVDHCHTTNKVRALLCGVCNMTLGAVKENVKVLEALINYIRNHKGHHELGRD